MKQNQMQGLSRLVMTKMAGEVSDGRHRPQEPPADLAGEEAERWRQLMAIVPSGLVQVVETGVEALSRDPVLASRLLAAHRGSTIQKIGRALGGAKLLEAVTPEQVRLILNMDPRLLMMLAQAAVTRTNSGLGELTQSEVNEIMDVAAVSSVMDESSSDDCYLSDEKAAAPGLGADPQVPAVAG